MKIKSLRLSRICYHVMFLEFSSATRRLQSVKKRPFREIFSWKVFDLPQVWIFTKWSSYWTHGHGRKGPIKFLGIASLYFRGCAWQPDLLKKKKYSRKNALKVGFFWIRIPLKFWSLNKAHFFEKSSSWDIGQNAFGQLGNRTFKSNVSLEKNDEIAWFFACWYKFMEIKSWLKGECS